jgi:hypothetical protein
MPIAPVNSATVTVNAVLAEQILIAASVSSQGQLTVSARAVLCGAECDNAGTATEKWTPAGPRKSVFIPDVNNLAGQPSTADLASLQSQFNAALSALETVLAAVNQVRKLV